MKTKTIIAVTALASACAVGGWWLAQPAAPHKHQLEKRLSPAGKVYYTCAMHPQVRQDQPGSCPICGMKLISRSSEPSPAASTSAPLYWYDPMRPDQHFEQPGKSPFMDMQLVPKYADAASSNGLVAIDPRMAQNLGIRTAAVQQGSFWQRIEAVGSVALDERQIITIESRSAGWIEHLDVRAEGDPVRQGQRLAALYSPELFAAQQELKLAQKLGDTPLILASQQRLKLLGGHGGNGPQSGLFAPISGFVLALMAREGAQLNPGMPLMKLASLSTVWLLIEVPEAQAAWLSTGRPAEAQLPALPGQTFEGTVDYLYPQLDPATRTLKVRLLLNNPKGQLRPGMFAHASLFGGPQQNVLLVPSEAIIRTGERSVVMLAETAGHYRPAEVTLGAEREGQTVVLSGLEAGQQVVVSGQFLLDSEASLLGAYQRLGTSPLPKEPQP